MEFIGWTVEAFHLYKPLIPLLNGIADRQNVDTIFDLCSGTGNPVIYLTEHSKIKKATLSDFYPQEVVLPRHINYLPNSIDAKQPDVPQRHIATMFNAFHHFNGEEQTQILSTLIANEIPFCIVEILNPNPLDFVKIFLTTTVGQLLVAPLVKPFSWMRLLFTYLIPINLITITYDGLISVLKSASLKEYQQLINSMDTRKFRLKTHPIKAGWGSRLTVITGEVKIGTND